VSASQEKAQGVIRQKNERAISREKHIGKGTRYWHAISQYDDDDEKLMRGRLCSGPTVGLNR